MCRAIAGAVSTQKAMAAAPISLNFVMRFLPLVPVTQVTKYHQVPCLASERKLNRDVAVVPPRLLANDTTLWQQRRGRDVDLCQFYKGLLKRPALGWSAGLLLKLTPPRSLRIQLIWSCAASFLRIGLEVHCPWGFGRAAVNAIT